MSSVKAEWRLAELDLDSDDPFDTLILSTGLSVDLSGSEQEIQAGIKRTLLMESHLYDRGVTCALKDGGQDCRTCPVYGSDERIEHLCQLGRDQVLLVDLAQKRAAERNKPFRVLGDTFRRYAEHAAHSGLLAGV